MHRDLFKTQQRGLSWNIYAFNFILCHYCLQTTLQVLDSTNSCHFTEVHKCIFTHQILWLSTDTSQYTVAWSTTLYPSTHLHRLHADTPHYTWMQNEKQQCSSFRLEQWFNVVPDKEIRKEGAGSAPPLIHTKQQTYKHTSPTPLQSYQQSKISLTFQLNTTYHHRPALSAVIYTRRLREGGREDHGEPICVYGFAGKEINDLPFLFGFNEVGTEGLPSIPFSLHACPLPLQTPPPHAVLPLRSPTSFSLFVT